MKAITIHGIDEEMSRLIRSEAYSQGLSLNKTIKQLLAKALGLTVRSKKRNDFSEFFGVWSKKEAEAFDKALEKSGVERIDEEDWQ